MPPLTHRYAPRGAAKQLLAIKDPEVLMAGPAGTGKSRACLEKLMLAALKYPGMRGLIVRKTASSLTSTTLVTWKKAVIKELLEQGQVVYYGGSASEPAQYKFTNGSVILMAGMDKATKIMSSEFDMIYVGESTELSENDLEMLATRLRNGRMPYQQLIADCNPDAPTHWLKMRVDIGKTVMLESKHKDNPVYYTDDEQLTDQGKPYITRLQNLTGIRKLRLCDGVWAGAEGLIYEGFEIVEPFTIPDSWARYWSLDFGYRNPFVCQFWAEDNDGNLFLYREIYRTSRIVSEHATQIRGLLTDTEGKWIEPKPQVIIADHDMNGREEFAKIIGMSTTAAHKNVIEGIQAVQDRLKLGPDGKPRLFILKNALVERDQELVDAKRPTCTAEEVLRYVWDANKEAPVKEHDHGMDAMRYLVAHKDLGGRPNVRWLG